MINFNTTGSSAQSPIVRETGRVGTPTATVRHPGEEDRVPEIRIRGTDSVNISELARRLAELPRSAPVRQDLVDRVRAEIEAGNYDTADKLEIATERLLGELDILG
jgi:anti-sigma28 factor (negative regulator of flagellin synthesis)